MKWKGREEWRDKAYGGEARRGEGKRGGVPQGGEWRFFDVMCRAGRGSEGRRHRERHARGRSVRERESDILLGVGVGHSPGPTDPTGPTGPTGAQWLGTDAAGPSGLGTGLRISPRDMSPSARPPVRPPPPIRSDRRDPRPRDRPDRPVAALHAVLCPLLSCPAPPCHSLPCPGRGGRGKPTPAAPGPGPQDHHSRPPEDRAARRFGHFLQPGIGSVSRQFHLPRGERD
jgi:hypothetical protein